ncbi:CLUMA_CG016729, isoform A [Clunio marinus]|uniref:CLUMA_CG016729, isoform A n=1 Tax=Clunio marinus TaxID=568069 RepID=A0A1J1IXK4_9DIPT|nr:CLUMA_CG016729, isoform A [Clunio marinus]
MPQHILILSNFLLSLAMPMRMQKGGGGLYKVNILQLAVSVTFDFSSLDFADKDDGKSCSQKMDLV